jgi:hypothetical protein
MWTRWAVSTKNSENAELVLGPDGFIDSCIPTLAAKPPSGPGWVHEIKHDG